jgi:8-oxo-dGTP diphosphatase
MDVTCAILIKNGQILIARRAHGERAGLWEFPGGKVQQGETAEECIVRELKEELNITVFPGRELPAVLQHYSDRTIRLIPFICEEWSGVISLTVHDKLEWTTLSHISNYDLCDADKKVVALLAQKP